MNTPQLIWEWKLFITLGASCLFLLLSSKPKRIHIVLCRLIAVAMWLLILWMIWSERMWINNFNH